MTITSLPRRVDYDCPDWCQRTDHNADEFGPGFPPMHYGPDLGVVTPQSNGYTTEALVYLGSEAAAKLRAAAADMVTAAERLEGHRTEVSAWVPASESAPSLPSGNPTGRQDRAGSHRGGVERPRSSLGAERFGAGPRLRARARPAILTTTQNRHWS